MKINYNYTAENLKKYILKSRLVNNIILFILGTLLYIWLTYNRVSLVYLPIFMVVFLIFIYLLNKLYIVAYFKVNDMLNYNICGKYTLELTPNKFSLTVNGKKEDYKYKNIKKIKEKKNYFIIVLGRRNTLTFEKYLFDVDSYNNILKMFKEKVVK